ncbi:MAG: TolB family protein, partial [Planctomycetota bacterium]
MANLYVMDPDGSGVRRLCFDQDHDMHPSVRNNGSVVYNRWDYTGINRLFLRELMVMNPDGTGQRALYGSNSWFPNGLYSPHELPGTSGRFLCILAGYHGSNRSGRLVVVDTNKGTKEADGIVMRVSGRDLAVGVEYVDSLTENEWPQFVTPRPITDKKFLVSAWMSGRANRMGVYLADAFDNLVLLHETDGYALLEPIPILRRRRPPVPADRVDLTRKDAAVYLQDVYAGPGLRGVPRGA